MNSIQSFESDYRLRLAEVYELILAISANSNAGPFADDDESRLLTERVGEPRSQSIIDDSVVSGEEYLKDNN